jgi:hypothetical protein
MQFLMCHSLKKMVRADSSCSLLTGQPHPAAFWKATQCCHVRANSDAGRDWLRTTRDAPLTPLLGEIKGFANCQELGTKIKSYFLGSHLTTAAITQKEVSSLNGLSLYTGSLLIWKSIDKVFSNPVILGDRILYVDS